jgi:hypothetical protein
MFKNSTNSAKRHGTGAHIKIYLFRFLFVFWVCTKKSPKRRKREGKKKKTKTTRKTLLGVIKLWMTKNYGIPTSVLYTVGTVPYSTAEERKVILFGRNYSTSARKALMV